MAKGKRGKSDGKVAAQRWKEAPESRTRTVGACQLQAGQEEP
jgi:hypothetical protein